MRLLLTRDESEFEWYTRPWYDLFEPYVQKMGREISAQTKVGSHREFIRTYHNVRTPMRKMEYSFAFRVFKLLRRLNCECRTVLDVGCGWSPFGCVVADIFSAEVTCLDKDRELIGFLSEYAPSWMRSVQWTYGDLLELSYPDNHFDVVTCISVLEHIPRGLDSQALRELMRILKPNGILILTVDWGPSSLIENLFRFLRRSVTGVKRLATGSIKEVVQAAVGPKPYTTGSLVKYLVKECLFIGVTKESFESLKRVTTCDISSWWVRHGLPDYTPPRTYYAAVGLVGVKNVTLARRLEENLKDLFP